MIDTSGKTLQQVNDELAEILSQQVERCMSDEGHCAYGNAREQHCAVGWFLDPSIDGVMDFRGGVQTLVNSYESLGPNDEFILGHVEFLQCLQDLHDRSFKADREAALERIVSDHGLDMTAWQPWVELGRVS